MATLPVHRHGDLRSCGATTVVTGQSNVFINGKLVSVKDDPNTHKRGELTAGNNDGSVFINGKPIVLLNSGAKPDLLCAPIGPPHCNPMATTASPDVFACGGEKPSPIGDSGGGGAASGGGRGTGGGGRGGSGGTGGTGGASGDDTQQNYSNRVNIKTAQETYEYLRDTGLTHEQAIGVLANIERESNFNAAAIGDNGNSYGLFQFNRAAGRLDPFVANVPDWQTNPSGQIDHMFKSDRAGVNYKNTNFSNSLDAANYFTNKVEIPQNRANYTAPGGINDRLVRKYESQIIKRN